MPFEATQIDLLDDYTKRSKSEKQMPYDVTYLWNLEHNTNEVIYETKKLID